MIPILIIILGCILIFINLKALKNENNTFKSVLKDKEANVSESNLEILQLRRELAESLLEIQQEIEELKMLRNESHNVDENGVVSEINFNYIESLGKAEAVEYLIKNGLTDDEICNKLSIGKGEVLLVKGLLKN